MTERSAPLAAPFWLARAFVLPPLVATAAHLALYLGAGGLRRCYEQLDLATPGLVCAPGLTVPVAFIGLALVQLSLGSLLLAWVRRRLQPARAAWLVAALPVLGALGWYATRRAATVGWASAGFEVAIEYATPVLLMLWLTQRWARSRGRRVEAVAA